MKDDYEMINILSKNMQCLDPKYVLHIFNFFLQLAANLYSFVDC